ncbi:hypothetical protein K1719_029549 [Acacia pycnantha]|nr:hypothetical protein K1719_029549 [Acacia pycnantha]
MLPNSSFEQSVVLLSAMSTLRPDPTCRIYPEPEGVEIDHFDRLPDSLLLLVFNRIGDVKALGRCCVVSRRFHSLVPQVENVVVRVDCVISDDDSSSSAASSDKSRDLGFFLSLIPAKPSSWKSPNSVQNLIFLIGKVMRIRKAAKSDSQVVKSHAPLTEHEHECQRPAFRVDTAQIDMYSDSVVLMSDHSLFPYGSLEANLCISVEIKGIFSSMSCNIILWLLLESALSNTELSLQGYSKCIRQESSQAITWTGHLESRFTFDLVADENVSQVHC